MRFTTRKFLIWTDVIIHHSSFIIHHSPFPKPLKSTLEYGGLFNVYFNEMKIDTKQNALPEKDAHSFNGGSIGHCMDRFERIKMECFWDYHISSQEIQKMLTDKDSQKVLFEKFLLNSSHLFEDLDLFHRQDLKKLLENYHVPEFNQAYCQKRKNLAEVYFFDKPLLIQELQWIC
jgi:hypothetical protein